VGWVRVLRVGTVAARARRTAAAVGLPVLAHMMSTVQDRGGRLPAGGRRSDAGHIGCAGVLLSGSTPSKKSHHLRAGHGPNYIALHRPPPHKGQISQVGGRGAPTGGFLVARMVAVMMMMMMMVVVVVGMMGMRMVLLLVIHGQVVHVSMEGRA